MADISISFITNLSENRVRSFREPNGPYFHRWLPHGEPDSISIAHECDGVVKLWFERRGCMKDGWVEFDNDQCPVGDDNIRRQGRLDGGYLRGRVLMHNVPVDQAEAVLQDAVDSDEYQTLGRHVVKKAFDPTVIRFCKIVRDLLGQFWIDVPSGFDSRKCSLGTYCRHRNMEWTIGDATGDFRPTKDWLAPIGVEGGIGDCLEFISRDDWRDIETLLEQNYDPTLAMAIATRANRLQWEGRYSHALVEAATGLEIAVDAALKNKVADGFDEEFQAFFNMPVAVHLIVAAKASGVGKKAITEALEGIEARNAIVHDGKPAPSNAKKLIRSMLKLIAALDKPMMRLVAGIDGNVRNSEEGWVERSRNRQRLLPLQA